MFSRLFLISTSFVFGLFLSIQILNANGTQNLNSDRALPPVPSDRGNQQDKSKGDTTNSSAPQKNPVHIPVTIEGPVTVINEPTAEEKARKAQQQTKSFWEKVGTDIFGSPQEIISLGTLVTTGLAASFAFGAYRAARRQADAAERQVHHLTSAHILVDSVRVEGFVLGQEPTFFVKIVNTGAVTADDVEISIRVEADRNYCGAKYTGGANLISIPANGHREYFITVNRPLTEGHMSGFKKGELFLRVTGQVAYEGRIQTYCYKYNPSKHPRPAGVPEFIPCEFDIRRTTLLTVSDSI